MTHSSAAGHRRGADDSYERLEFLGDRVLGLIVADLLYRSFSTESEGALARRHADLVRREALARVAGELALGEFLVLAKSEEDAGGRNNPALQADACEALIGALYLDGGLAAARTFVERHWRPLLAASEKPPQDPKTALQEWAQARGLALPVYRELDRTGPPHDPVFVIEASVAGYPPEVGEGRSKRLAEREAAERLLSLIAARKA
jgi:ribonuclease-3